MKNELYILWTSDNIVTAEKMVLLYAHNSLKKEWWDSITVIIWGASAVLASENLNIQTKIPEMISDGVKFSACKACADMLGVSDKLESLGIEIKYWGDPLTELIKSGKKIITV